MGEKQLLRELDEYCKGKDMLGNLYLFELSPTREIPIYLPLPEIITEKPSHPKIPFDRNTGNVHMIPADHKIAELCASIIEEKYDSISHFIVDKIELKPTKPENIRILNKTPYEDSKYLFAYVGVYGKETEYDLVFNRFFVDDNNHVNCILLCPQIKMYERGNEPKSIEYYPDTSKPDKGNTVYYNLDVDIHDSSEKIAKAFLEFVRKKENERA